jgi:DNA helicase INO80
MHHPLPPSSPNYRSRPSAAPSETPNVSTPSHINSAPCADTEQPPPRSANPMSMSNLLSDSGPSEPPPPPPPVAAPPARRSPEVLREPVKPYLAPHPAPVPEAYPPPVAPAAAPVIDNNNIKRERNGDVPPVAPPVSATPYPTGPPGLTIEATEAAFAEIESAEMSDVEGAGFEGPKNAWRARSAKRMIEIEQKELGKRKV